MATKTFNARFQFKGDTLQNWNQANPVLLKNEVAIVEVPAQAGAVAQEPAILFKVGDGTTAFSDLGYVSAKAADVYDWAKATAKPSYTADEISGLADYIAGEIAAADHLHRKKVDSVDDINVAAADADKYIYMVPKDGGKNGDKYDEYMVIDGAVEPVGDWAVDLSGYVQKEDGKGLSTNDYTATDKDKLASIEADADVNIIETVKVNGAALTPDAGKAVDITIPTGTLAGKDKVAEADLTDTLKDKLDAKADDVTLAAVAKSGNVNDLVQSTGDVIVFNCGTATTVI